jgi:hypothetical protein
MRRLLREIDGDDSDLAVEDDLDGAAFADD